MSTVADWWYDGTGENLLKGVEGDPDNPIRLADYFIVDFLSKIPAAVESFNRIVPTMLPDEQTRLYALQIGTPKYTYEDPRIVADAEQRSWNRKGVRTRIPHE